MSHEDGIRRAAKPLNSIFSIVRDGQSATLGDERASGRSASDFIELCHRDLGIIRQDLVSVMQETADVRASLAQFSSAKPVISRLFIVTFGLIFLLIIFFMILYQPRLHEWLQFVSTFL